MTVGLVLYSGAALLAAPCSHIHIYSNPEAQNDVSNAIAAYLKAHPAPKPVTTVPAPPAGLSVTHTSIGTAKIGMTLQQLEQATGQTYTNGGDGLWESDGPVIAGNGSDGFQCYAVGQAKSGAQPTTTEGFALGSTLEKLQSIYGASLHYTPGVESQAGQVPGWYVAYPDGVLYFVVRDDVVFNVSVLSTTYPLRPCP